MIQPIAIPTSAKRTDVFTPPSLEETPKALSFQIRVPTPSERDTIGTRLFELGLTSISDDTMRAHMIDELFKLDWTDLTGEVFDTTEEGRAKATAFNETYAESSAEFLDDYWQRQKTEDLAMDLWREQEAQRMLDEADDAPQRDPAPQPVKLIKIRDHARAQLLIDELVTRSQRLRTLTARKLDYGRRNAELMIRLQLLSIEPIDPAAFVKVDGAADVVLERDKTGLITVASLDTLREFIGNTAWNELVQRVDSHFTLTETERKNSDSPLERPSDQTGSHEPSGDLGNNGGGWTESSTGQTQSEGSGKTIARSSDSASGNEGPKRKSGRTAGA